MTHQGVTFYQDGGYFIKTAISYKLFSPPELKKKKKEKEGKKKKGDGSLLEFPQSAQFTRLFS